MLVKLFKTVLEANEKSSKYYFFMNYSGHINRFHVFYTERKKYSDIIDISDVTEKPNDKNIEEIIKKVEELANDE